jgi:hypothetical protein
MIFVILDLILYFFPFVCRHLELLIQKSESRVESGQDPWVAGMWITSCLLMLVMLKIQKSIVLN